MDQTWREKFYAEGYDAGIHREWIVVRGILN